MFFYRLLNYISLITSSLCILAAVYYIVKGARSVLGKEGLSFSEWIAEIKNQLRGFFGSYATIILVVALLSTLIVNPVVHQIVGIHNLKIKPEGTYCFYVDAQRLGGKNYALPAQIRIEKVTDEVGDKERTYTYYYIEKLFFSNGEILVLDESDPAEINEPVFQNDSKGDEWRLTLLNKHAYSPNMTETNNADWLNITFLLIRVIPTVFLLFVMLCKEKRSEKAE